MMTLGMVKLVKLDFLFLPRRNLYHTHHISAHCFQIRWILFIDISRFYMVLQQYIPFRKNLDTRIGIETA